MTSVLYIIIINKVFGHPVNGIFIKSHAILNAEAIRGLQHNGMICMKDNLEYTFYNIQQGQLKAIME